MDFFPHRRGTRWRLEEERRLSMWDDACKGEALSFTAESDILLE